MYSDLKNNNCFCIYMVFKDTSKTAEDGSPVIEQLLF